MLFLVVLLDTEAKGVAKIVNWDLRFVCCLESIFLKLPGE